MNTEEQLRDAARQWIEAGGSQNQLAKAAGVSQSVVSEFMRGNGLTLRVADKVAAAVGRTIKVSKKRKGK